MPLSIRIKVVEFVSVEKIELSTNGLNGQIVKNSAGNQWLAVIRQSIGRVKRKVSWLPLVSFFKVQSTLRRPMYLLTIRGRDFFADCTTELNASNYFFASYTSSSF
jgi:hypothetical protein